LHRFRQEADLLQPGQSRPHHAFIRGDLQLVAQNLGQFGNASTAVTMAPKHRGALVQAMRIVVVQVVDEGFVGQVANEESLGAGAGKHGSLQKTIGNLGDWQPEIYLSWRQAASLAAWLASWQLAVTG
jgi:hypothetical protein